MPRLRNRTPGEMYKVSIDEEQNDFMSRRLDPFLTRFSLSRRPLMEILQSIYIQGMSDAIEAIEKLDARKLN